MELLHRDSSVVGFRLEFGQHRSHHEFASRLTPLRVKCALALLLKVECCHMAWRFRVGNRSEHVLCS